MMLDPSSRNPESSQSKNSRAAIANLANANLALATERFGLLCEELSQLPHDARFGHHGEVSVDCTTAQTYTVWRDEGNNITRISVGSLEEPNAGAIAVAAAAAAAEADYTLDELYPLDDEDCAESEPATNPPDPVEQPHELLAEPNSKAAPTTDVTALRLQVRRNGFNPIPVEGKAPSMRGWQQKFDESEEEIPRWEKTYPRARNTGVLAKLTPGLDIDITIEAAAKAAEDKAREFLEEHDDVYVRFGAPPKRLIPLRTDEPFKKLYRAFKAPDGSEHKVEMLGDGQQYVVAGIHPDTRKPYSWFGSELTTIKRENLPYTRREDAEQLLSAIATALIEEHGFVLTSKSVDSTKQLDLPPKNAGGNDGEAPDRLKVAEGFADLPVEDAGETDHWWDSLSPEQKDAALDHGLECIANNSKLLELKAHGGGGYDNWFGITASVARSGAPHAEDIFVRHASTATNHDPEDALRQKFKDCQKNPRAEGFTVGTFIKWARQCGANFEPWLETYQSTIEPTKVKQRFEPINRDAPELTKLDAAWVTCLFEGDTDGKYQNDPDQFAFTVACELVRTGLDDQFIARVLMTTPCGAYVQESPPYRLNRTIRRAREFAIDPDLEKMNSQHAVLPIGGSGKARVVTWGDDYEFPGRKTIVWSQTFDDFRNLHSNKRKQVRDGKDDDGKTITKSIPLGTWWLGQRRRRQYDGGQRFMPQHLAEVVGNTLNMFEGFPIQPRKPEGRSAASACNLILDHGFKIICNGNEEHWNYLLKHEAWIAQNRQRSEIAVGLRTDAEGAGKGKWCNYIGRLYGQHYMQVKRPEHVVGKHNHHLETLIKLCADEAVFVGDPRHRNALFGLITEPTIDIEPKFIGMYQAPNFLNLDIISNSKHFLPGSRTARRLFVPTVSENRVEDFDYFSALDNQFHNGGAEALLYHLLHEVDLRDFNVRKVPKTAGLAEQIELSRKGIDGLVEKICNEGCVPCPHEEWSGFSVSTGAEERKGFDYLIDNHHDRELRDLGALKVKRQLCKNWGCKSGDDARRWNGNKIIRGIKWPELKELRELFVTLHGPQEWLNPEVTEWPIQPTEHDYWRDD